jgi:hypothetical protein
MKTYKNRYGDIYTFTQSDDNNILWEGNFEYCRITMSNDYMKAYKAYLEDNCYSDHCLMFSEFKNAIHEYNDIKRKYKLGFKYLNLVEPLTDKSFSVDPSGGPFIALDMPLTSFGFENHIVKDFERTKTGYKIITKIKL